MCNSYGCLYKEYIVCEWACANLHALTSRAEAVNVRLSGVLWEERREWEGNWEGIGKQTGMEREGRREASRGR